MEPTEQVAPEAAPAVAPALERFRALARPSFGREGKRVMLDTNYFNVAIDLSCGAWHQYRLTFNPDFKKNKEKKRFVVHHACNVVKPAALQGMYVAYDGDFNIYTPHPFASDDFNFTFEMAFEEARRPFPITLSITKVADISLTQLDDFLAKRTNTVDSALIAALDIIFKTTAAKDHVIFGQSVYTGRQRDSLGGGVSLYHGLFQSIRPTNWKISLNGDIAHTAFYEEVNLVDFAANALHMNARDLERGLTEQQTHLLLKSLKGLQVVAKHNNRKYKVFGLSEKRLREITFDNKEGATINVMDYFEERYKLRLRYTALPCIQTGTKERNIFVPLEVLTIAPKQRFIKNMSDRMKADMIKKSVSKPRERRESILRQMKDAQFDNDDYLKQFGISVNYRLTEIEGRILDPPTIEFATSKDTPRAGTWDLRNKRMTNANQLDNWGIVCFDQRLQQPSIKSFFEFFIGLTGNHGFKMSARPDFLKFMEPQNNMEADLTELDLAYKDTQLFFVILPDKSISFYGQVKNIFDSKLGRLSQCLTSAHFSKSPAPQLVSNILLKVNVKLGGFNHGVVSPGSTRPLLADPPTLLIGADVSHPGPGSREGVSIAGVVAAMNFGATRYLARTRRMPFRQEIISELEDIVFEILTIFYRENGRVKPARIVVYRDGVSERQYGEVLTCELAAIQRACRRLPGDYSPAITYCIAQKTHRTRFFQNNGQDCDRSGNPLPGTIVDTAVTNSNYFDFYLLSHSGIQGTSRPTYYCVLYDDSNFDASAFHRFTYNLCFVYQRCTRSISVVAPVYYAHMIAMRSRMYLKHSTGSGEGSVVSGGSGPKDSKADDFGDLHENLRGTMHYV